MTDKKPEVTIELTLKWRPFIVTEDGLLKEPTRDGYGYKQPVFDRDFTGVQDFYAFLAITPGEPYIDQYEGEFVLLPVFRRAIREKR